MDRKILILNPNLLNFILNIKCNKNLLETTSMQKRYHIKNYKNAESKKEPN